MRATAKRGKEKSARSRASLKRVAKKLAKAPPRKRRRRVRKPASRIYHPGPLIDGEAALAVGVAALAAQDPEAIAHMLEIGGPTPLRRREPGFEGLAAIIVSQQVSTASARAIHGRLAARFPAFDAAELLAADDETLRACGLSR